LSIHRYLSDINSFISLHDILILSHQCHWWTCVAATSHWFPWFLMKCFWIYESDSHWFPYVLIILFWINSISLILIILLLFIRIELIIESYQIKLSIHMHTSDTFILFFHCMILCIQVTIIFFFLKGHYNNKPSMSLVPLCSSSITLIPLVCYEMLLNRWVRLTLIPLCPDDIVLNQDIHYLLSLHGSLTKHW